MARAGTLVLSLLCLSAPAGAGENVLPAATGYWVEIAGTTQDRTFSVFDGKVCREASSTVAGAGFSISDYRFWYTPIVLHEQPTTVTITQRVVSPSNVRSKGYSFDATGTILSSTGAKTSAATVGTLTMFPQGTALVQTEMRTVNDDPGCADNYRINW